MKLSSQRKFIIKMLINKKLTHNCYLIYDGITRQQYIISSKIVNSQRCAFNVKQIQNNIIFAIYLYDGINYRFEQIMSHTVCLNDLFKFRVLVQQIQDKNTICR